MKNMPVYNEWNLFIGYIRDNKVKIYFRIPFTEYFLAKHHKLCLVRKAWNNKDDGYAFKIL